MSALIPSLFFWPNSGSGKGLTPISSPALVFRRSLWVLTGCGSFHWLTEEMRTCWCCCWLGIAELQVLHQEGTARRTVHVVQSKGKSGFPAIVRKESRHAQAACCLAAGHPVHMGGKQVDGEALGPSCWACLRLVGWTGSYRCSRGGIHGSSPHGGSALGAVFAHNRHLKHSAHLHASCELLLSSPDKMLPD